MQIWHIFNQLYCVSCFFAESNRSALVKKGAVQLFIDLLETDDTDVQYYCAAAISNLAVDETHRAAVVKEGNHRVLSLLLRLLKSPSDKVRSPDIPDHLYHPV